MKKVLKLTVAAIAILAFASSCGAKAKKTEESNEKVASTIHLNKADFLKKVANFETGSQEWKYLGDKPAIIEYYADWCGPCKMIAPVLDSLAAEYAGKIYIYKINAEEERVLANIFGVSGYPTFLFIPMEGAPRIAVGALPKEDIVNAIETVLLVGDSPQNESSEVATE